jgi:hypothetical protein
VVLSRLRVPLRVAFALGFFGLEGFGIYWGQHAPDRAYGFQMFNESSRVTIRLFREVTRRKRRVLLPLPEGRWRADDARGVSHEFSWDERVRTARLNELGQSIHAQYGLDAQLFRLQAALEDVASHIPQDSETLALVADVETIKNGKPGPQVRLRADRP